MPSFLNVIALILDRRTGSYLSQPTHRGCISPPIFALVLADGAQCGHLLISTYPTCVPLFTIKMQFNYLFLTKQNVVQTGTSLAEQSVRGRAAEGGGP
jgi:hypothetical protein